MIEISDILKVCDHVAGLKAIIFDLDDTLYGEKEYVRSGYQKIAEILPSVENAAEKLWKLFEERKPAIDELLKQENIVSEEVRQECLRVYRNQIPNIHLYPGVKDMITEFRKSGMKLGIITDGRPEGQRAKLEVLGLDAMVDHIIVTDEFGGPEFRKPNPLAFETMKKLLDVEYSEMCYVGDNIKKDFISPEKLGMRSIWFRNKDGLYTT